MSSTSAKELCSTISERTLVGQDRSGSAAFGYILIGFLCSALHL